MEVKFLQTFLPRRRRRTLNKESSRKWMREQTHGKWFIYDLLGHLKKESLVCLRIGKYTSVLIVEYIVVDFTNCGR